MEMQLNGRKYCGNRDKSLNLLNRSRTSWPGTATLRTAQNSRLEMDPGNNTLIMRLIISIFAILSFYGCVVPPETPNRHYTITVTNQSDQAIYVTFCRSYHTNPSGQGQINYYDLKFERPGDIMTPYDYLILPGEINRSALDIGSWDGYNWIEADMALCNWIIYFLDANVVDSTPFEELNWTFKGVLFQKEYTLEEIRDLNFMLTYPEVNTDLP